MDAKLDASETLSFRQYEIALRLLASKSTTTDNREAIEKLSDERTFGKYAEKTMSITELRTLLRKKEIYLDSDIVKNSFDTLFAGSIADMLMGLNNEILKIRHQENNEEEEELKQSEMSNLPKEGLELNTKLIKILLSEDNQSLKVVLGLMIKETIIDFERLVLNDIVFLIVVSRQLTYVNRLVIFQAVKKSQEASLSQVYCLSVIRLEQFFWKTKALQDMKELKAALHSTLSLRNFKPIETKLELFFSSFIYYPLQSRDNLQSDLDLYDVILIDHGKYYQAAIYRGDSCTFLDCSTNTIRDANILKENQRFLGLYKLCCFLPKGDLETMHSRRKSWQTENTRFSETSSEEFATFCIYGKRFSRKIKGKHCWSEFVTSEGKPAGHA